MVQAIKCIRNSTKYGFSSGQISVLEKRLLTKNMIERLIDSKDFAAKIHILAETNYGHLFHSANSIEELELAFENALEEIYNSIAQISENPLLLDFFKLKYDYHNLKVAIKKHLLGPGSETYFKIGKYDSALFEKLVEDTDSVLLDNNFKETTIKVFKIFKNTNKPNLIDIVIDHRYFDHLLSLAKQLKSSHLVMLVRTMMDLANIKVAFRHIRFEPDSKLPENHLITGGFIKTTDIQAATGNKESFFTFLKNSKYEFLAQKLEKGISIEKLTDDFIIELNRNIKYEIAGIEILNAYFMAREFEVKTLRLIMIGSFRSFSRQTIKDRMISTYG
jgi:V/A-type H+-transporting ATPase subunit C